MLQVEVIAVVVSCVTLSMTVCSEVLAGGVQTLTMTISCSARPIARDDATARWVSRKDTSRKSARNLMSVS